jgi:alanine dehydrogenase
MIICILKESKINELRTPLVPKDILLLKKSFPKLHFLIEPSKQRIINDHEYYKVGCEKFINQKVDLFLSVKAVSLSKIKLNQNYMMFSHTIKGQVNNMPLLKKILKGNCSLIDYELFKNKKGKRQLGFGWYAGIMGAYLTLSRFLRLKKKQKKNYITDNLIKNFQNVDLQDLKILITGDGLVSEGVQFFLKKIGFFSQQNQNGNNPSFKVLSPSQYYRRVDGRFNINDLMRGKGKYESQFTKYIDDYNIYLACHYWDSRFPKLFNKSDVNREFFKIIGDITCDINGSVPTTIKSTSLASPYFRYKNMEVMAVDNLPSGLSLEASKYFSSKLKVVLPKILKSLNEDTIEEYYVSKKGYINFRYLNLLNCLI